MNDETNPTNGSEGRSNEQENAEGVIPDLAAVFGRQLKWRLQLAYLDDLIVIQCVHDSHVKASARYERGSLSTAQSPVEQLAESMPSFEARMPKAWFTSEEHIKSWFMSVCDAFDANLYGILQFEIQHHFSDVMRFQLDHDGIHQEDKNKIIEDHIEGDPSSPRDIGTRELLRILLAARGSSNKSPANEINLPWLISTALSNLANPRLLTYQGVNGYLKKHFPSYAQASGDSLRKLCKECGVDFMTFVQEERARRSAEN